MFSKNSHDSAVTFLTDALPEWCSASDGLVKPLIHSGQQCRCSVGWMNNNRNMATILRSEERIDHDNINLLIVT